MLFADVIATLRGGLAGPLPGAEAHLSLAPRQTATWRPGVVPAAARRAAALVLLYPVDDRAHVVLTVRTDDLPHHGGQVCLPGGGLDPEETIELAAKRETYEELGVPPEEIDIIGSLTPVHIVVSRFALHPLIASCARRPEFRPAVREVARVLEVPLSALTDPARLGRERRFRDGVDVDVPYLDISGYHVWGATGMVLAELMFLLGWRPFSPAEIRDVHD